MDLKTKAGSEQVEYYALSPFDQLAVDKNTQITAITVLSVFILIQLTGLLGHYCAIYFITGSRCRSSSCFSGYVIIGNLTTTHLLFLTTCLPAIAYTSLMNLVTGEWLLGDAVCRIVPFLERLFMGVTTLSYCALAIDRFRSAGHVNKGYEIVPDSFCRGVCKMLVLWVGAFLLASPELLLHETRTITIPAYENQLMNEVSKSRFTNDVLMTHNQYKHFRDLSYDVTMSSKTQDEDLQMLMENLNQENWDQSPLIQVENPTGNGTLLVQYEQCVVGTLSWKDDFPPIFNIFITKYSSFKHWWFLAFYFCLPVFFSLLFAVLVAFRLSVAVRNVTNAALNSTGSYYITNGADVGTLNSQRDVERAPISEDLNYPTGSLLSSRTHGSDAHYQYRTGQSLDRHMTQSYQTRHQPRLSPLLSNENVTIVSPVGAVSTSSFRTLGSFSRPPGELSPLSPTSPSLACASGVSVLSLATSNAQGGGTLGASSLPPHGRRRSSRRKSSRAFKVTLENVSRERAINSVLVSFILAFTLLQLPLLIITILRKETNVMSLLESRYETLASELCLYMSILTYMVNPFVMFICYKPFRAFLANHCCC